MARTLSLLCGSVILMKIMNAVASVVIAGAALAAQASLPFDSAQGEPKNWTAAEDHQQMMDQLGIKTLRPGPSGNEQAPNHANYDEGTANPFPDLPDVLTLKNGGVSLLKTKYIPAAVWTQTQKAKAGIVSGKIKVPNCSTKGCVDKLIQ